MGVSKSIVSHLIAVWVAQLKHWPVSIEKICRDNRNDDEILKKKGTRQLLKFLISRDSSQH